MTSFFHQRHQQPVTAPFLIRLRCIAKKRYGSCGGIDCRWKLKAGPEFRLARSVSQKVDGDQAVRRDRYLPFASRLMALLSNGPLAEQPFGGGIPIRVVAQAVGFGLGRPKMHDLSMRID